MLCVPLLRGDELLGVLHVGRLDGRPFSDGDGVLLQVVGDRIAGATQTRQLADERAGQVLRDPGICAGRAARYEISGCAGYFVTCLDIGTARRRRLA